MYTLLRYGVGGLLYTFLLGVLFDSINPASWPKSAVGFEVAGCWVFIALILGREDAKEKKRQEQTEMERHLTELHSKEKVELEKHRLTLAAQHGTDGARDKHSTAISPTLVGEQSK